jgi:hypothetical protein
MVTMEMVWFCNCLISYRISSKRGME